MILNRQRSVRLSIPPLEEFLRRVRRELKLEQAEVTVCLVSDAEIAGMNELFRKKQGPTDVLSFPAAQGRSPVRTRRPRVASIEMSVRKSLGDIAIAPAVARRNAKEYGRALPSQIKILILHGVLHLLGYDHEADHGQMQRKEMRLRKRLGLA
jgi:probable rRNA maturation factor